MGFSRREKYCEICGKNTQRVKFTFPEDLGCLLTFFSVGFFLNVWLLILIWEWLTPECCLECAKKDSMGIILSQQYCTKCNKSTLHARKKPFSFFNSAVLTLLSFGVYLPFWILFSIFDIGYPQYCQVCGERHQSESKPEIEEPKLPNGFSHASRIKRLVAFYIDYMVLCFFIMFLVFVLLGISFDNPEYSIQREKAKIVVFMCFLIFPFKDVLQGMSLGRMLLGIAVRDKDHPQNIPSTWRMVLRNLFLLIWPIEMIVLLVSKKRMRVGDKIARTVVVNAPRPVGKPMIIAIVLTMVLFLFLGTGLFVIQMSKNTQVYKISIDYLKHAPSVHEETGDFVSVGFFVVSSSYLKNGKAEGECSIKVIGTKKSVRYIVTLRKEPDSDWQVIDCKAK